MLPLLRARGAERRNIPTRCRRRCPGERWRYGGPSRREFVMPKQLQVQLPAPHAGQRQVLAEAKRFNVLAMGRRWGKTVIGCDRIVRPVLEGYPTAWFAPTFKLEMESWRTLQQVLAPVITSRNNAEYRLEVRGGGSLTLFSLDGDVSDTVRGRAFKRVVIDEAACVKQLKSVWENAIRATLADHQGDAFFLSTPRGMNDFKAFWDRGQDPERDDWASWQMPTSTNPTISPDEIESARHDLTEGAFNQEYLALFVNWEGAVFRRVLECATAERKDGPEHGHEYVIGADWGRSNDYTVFSVVDVTARCMVDMDRSNRVDYVVQRGRLQALCDRWRPSQIIAELNSIGQPICEELQRAGLPIKGFTTTNASKAEIIEALALAFEQGSIGILNDPVLLGELQAFAAEQLPGGMLRYAAPGGGHDDCVMSLALAWSVIRADKRCYGLIEFLSRVRVDGSEEQRIMAGLPTKPVIDTAAETPGCPNCGATTCRQPVSSGGWRCGHCGKGWNGRAPQNPAEITGNTRSTWRT
jgi:hypothetical protein